MSVLLLAGCSAQLSPGRLVGDITGSSLENRLPPPGLDRPLPNLGTVPERPARPDPAYRSSLEASLRADRSSSAEPLPARTGAAATFPTEAPGRPPIPGAPPPPPALARAEPVPWVAPGIPLQPGVVSPGETAPPAPGAVPSLPTPDMLGPPTAPPPVPSLRQP
ncbi:hypothetical protein EOD42_14640 [Rhodovarius crocodyli]|uniref:Uncharacterized protein n=1 Tax=Rhodovarius crocodyli TaxID=1979269 RepID=A0A437MFA2_9PROT|nr:hypothetical protein [Rhodovarius crocodyli]RVT96341.1 hypothetical protein EOD42_14640 [Rhodovarius crocodyli]